jgi:hypothetical protein
MKNLEQIRAAHALKFWNSEAARKLPGRECADILRQLPSLLMSHGLLATLAHAKINSETWKILMDELGAFLSPGKMGVLPAAAANLDNLIQILTQDSSDSLLLQRATAEIFLYLGYLKRFAPRPDPTARKT